MHYKTYSILLCLIFLHPFAQAQNATFDSTSHTLLKKGIHQIHVESYWEALKTFQALIKYLPQHPVGYFGAAGVYKTIMQNYRIKKYETFMDSLLTLAITKGEESKSKDPFVLFYMGGSYGFRGLHKVRKRDWFGAFRDGIKGLHALQDAIDINPDLNDAYYGLGTYHYWRSAKAKLLLFIPLIRNEKKRGIAEIWKAIRFGTYTPIEGKYALVAVYFDNKEYNKAFTINQDLISQFPTNPSSLYMGILLLKQQGKWLEAKSYCEKLLKHILSSEFQSIGYQVESHYHIAESLCHLKNYDEANIHLQKAISKMNDYQPDQEIEGPVFDYKNINNKINNLSFEIKKQRIESNTKQ